MHIQVYCLNEDLARNSALTEHLNKEQKPFTKQVSRHNTCTEGRHGTLPLTKFQAIKVEPSLSPRHAGEHLRIKERNSKKGTKPNLRFCDTPAFTNIIKRNAELVTENTARRHRDSKSLKLA